MTAGGGARMRGKGAVVTGAASGQGREHARLLAQEGAQVLLVDVIEEQGESAAAELRATGLSAEFLRADVGEEDGWRQILEAAESSLDGLDVLVNNAGVIRSEDFCLETLAGWHEVIRVNQTGVFLGIRASVPEMRRRGAGSIVNVSSNMGLAGMEGYAAYHASKGAVIAMTKSAAVSYGADGIRVNAICPGLVWTAMSAGDATNDEMLAQTPLGRGAEPDEISPGVVFLASDESRFVTGAVLVMDGGYLAR